MTTPSKLDEARLRELAEAARARFASPELKSDGYGNQVWAKSLKGGDTHVVDIRGWGYLTGRGHGALALTEEEGIAAQKAVQAYVVAAWNAVPHLLDALSAERERGDRAVGLLQRWVSAEHPIISDQVRREVREILSTQKEQ